MHNNTQSVNFNGSQNCMYVSTLNELRRYKPSTNGQVVLCSGQKYIGDGQGNFYAWSNTATGDDDGITIIVSQYSGQNGGRWLILNKQGNIDAVVASINNEIANRISADNTLQANINAETQRAEKAEQYVASNKVNRDGDTMYGTLNIQNNAGLLNTANYQHQNGIVDKTNGIIMKANGSSYLDISMKQNDSIYYGSLNLNGTEYTIGNSSNTNNLMTLNDKTPIVTGTITNGYYYKINNILVQSYVIHGATSSTFTFPMAYSQPPIIACTLHDGGGASAVANPTEITNTSSSWFLRYVGGGNNWGDSRGDLWVTLTGIQ